MRPYLLVLCIIVGCQSTKNNVSADIEETQKTQIENKLGGHATFIPNAKGNYLLCKRVDKANANQIDFLIYDNVKNEIIYQKKMVGGKVLWNGSWQVKITEALGNRTEDHPQGYRVYYYNVNERRLEKGKLKNN